jgi:hypothetical protein
VKQFQVLSIESGRPLRVDAGLRPECANSGRSRQRGRYAKSALKLTESWLSATGFGAPTLTNGAGRARPSLCYSAWRVRARAWKIAAIVTFRTYRELRLNIHKIILDIKRLSLHKSGA